MKKTASFTFFSLLLTITILSCADAERKKNNFPNDLKNSKWIIQEGGLFTIDGDTTYRLSKRIDTAFIFNLYAVDFLDQERFTSYDSWECGNDCFTQIFGRYYFTKADQIEMQVDSIARSGTCEAPTQVFTISKVMSFNMVKKGDQLQLIRK